MFNQSKFRIIFVTLFCLVAGVFALPNFVDAPKYLPQAKINLGLDLFGGSQLLLKVDFDNYLRDQTLLFKDLIKSELRANKIPYQSLIISDKSIHFSLTESEQQNLATKTIKRLANGLNITNNGNKFIIAFDEIYIKQLKDQAIEQSIDIIRRRIDETGTKEPSIQRQGDLYIMLQVAGLNDPEQLKRLLGKTAKLTFHLVDEIGSHSVDNMKVTSEKDENGRVFEYILKKKIELSGDKLVKAHSNIKDGESIIEFTFNSLGAKQFGELTKNNIGKRLAILLDNKVICAPVVNSSILGGSGIITGNFTPESARELATLLQAGALPAPLLVVEERVVGPSLGEDSIASGKIAALVSLMLVVGFMVATYGILGIFASIALFINLILIIALLSIIQATLTLPGIAGIILTMGMAVDANVLIFERIREELRGGLTNFAATERGFNQAFATILDSNLTTIIAAILLYMFGTGVIKGFAVTLSIGILTSMFSAITITKMMIANWLRVYRPKKIGV